MLLISSGRNPGTSTKVIIGISKQSQNRINLAALSDASISSTLPDKLVDLQQYQQAFLPFLHIQLLHFEQIEALLQRNSSHLQPPQ